VCVVAGGREVNSIIKILRNSILVACSLHLPIFAGTSYLPINVDLINPLGTHQAQLASDSLDCFSLLIACIVGWPVLRRLMRLTQRRASNAALKELLIARRICENLDKRPRRSREVTQPANESYWQYDGSDWGIRQSHINRIRFHDSFVKQTKRDRRDGISYETIKRMCMKGNEDC